MDLFSTLTDQAYSFDLERDIVFFDIESTGLNVLKDRIIQIALVKIKADASPHEEKEYLINPQIPISAEAMAVHGITPDMIKDKPYFCDVAKEIFEFIGESDLAGYLMGILPFDIFVGDLLPDGVDGIYAVLRNSCEQTYTYQVFGSKVRIFIACLHHFFSFCSP